MKRGILLILTFLLCLTLVSAQDLSISEIDSTTIIEPGEVGIYDLRVTNLDAYELQLQIQADPFAGLTSSEIEYVHIDPNFYTLEGHDSVDIQVEIKLAEDATIQKRYQTYITIEALNRDVSEEYSLQVFAKEPEDPISTYVSDIPETIAPGTDLTFTVSLENNMGESLSNVEVYASSEIFESQETIQLFPDQERDLEFNIPIESTTEAKDYTLNVRVYYEEELQATEAETFTVELYEDVSETVEDVDKLLHRIITITKTNNGNDIVGESYDFELGFFENLFASYTIDPTYKDQEGSHWSFNLDPGESYSIQIKVDYRPIFIAIVVLILFSLIAMYWASKGIIIKKSVFKLKQTTEGVSKLKIMLHIKNNTNKTVKKVLLIDILPRIINPSTTFGTLRPNNIERGTKGVRLIWKIPELVKGEERVISYEVEAKMKVFGTFALPPAMVRHKNKRGKVINSKSNKLSVMSGYVEEIRKKKKR